MDKVISKVQKIIKEDTTAASKRVFRKGCEYAISVLKETIKEQGITTISDCWTLCSKEMPKATGKMYEVTIERILGGIKQRYTDYCLLNSEGEWLTSCKVIAWREKTVPCMEEVEE